MNVLFQISMFYLSFNPNPLGIFTRKYPESTKIHQFCHTQNAGVLNPSESASVDIGHILNPPKSTTNFLVDFGRFRIPCSHENLYSMLLHRIHQNLTCNYNPSTNMTKQLKTIEILNPSKSATCSMWRYMYPESAKIFQYRGMDFDGFRVVRVNYSVLLLIISVTNITVLFWLASMVKQRVNYEQNVGLCLLVDPPGLLQA